MSLYPDGLSIALSLVAYNSLFTGFFILIKRRDFAGFQYFISSLFIFGWALGFSFTVDSSSTLITANFWGRFSQVCFFAMPITWFHFVLSYTGQSKKLWKELAVCYGATLFFLVTIGRRIFIQTFKALPDLHFYPVPGPGYKAMTLLFVVIMIYAFFKLYSFWRTESSILKKDDARFFFFTQLYGYGLCTLCFLPAYGVRIPQYQLLILPFWQFFLAYAMVRHHLLDYEALARAIHSDRLAAISRITSSLHHELKNPLTAIKTFTEFLPKKYDDPKFLETFKEIVGQEVKRINDLLQQLLEFSKPRDLELHPQSMEGLLEETLLFLRPSLEESEIEVQTHYKKVPDVLADKNQMKQVFLNLLLNSIQAMDEGGKLDIGISQDRFHHVVIQIADSGVGISKEHLKQIHEPYFSTKEKGSGLGLSIVQQIVSKHHAEMEIKSEEGKHTTIRVVMKELASASKSQ